MNLYVSRRKPQGVGYYQWYLKKTIAQREGGRSSNMDIQTTTNKPLC
jgi:hypothetical protein